jgi:tetratricopeptide (TPR) repeat protein
MEAVERNYAELAKYPHAEKSWADVSIVLQNLADAQTLCGALREAIASASEALFYAGVAEAEPIWIVALWRRLVEGAPRHALASSQTDAASLRQAMGPKAKASSRTPKRPSSLPARVVKMECESRVFRAHALSLAGELTASSRDFGAADTIERAEDSDNDALYSGRGIEWCRHRMQLGELAVARRLTEANRVICESQGANADLARCDLLLGEFDLEVGDRASAGRRIGEAVRVFREARQGQDLPEALLAQARLGRSMEDCEEALRMARKSTFALMECDALNLRAVLRRELAKPADLSVAAQKAYDDAHAALVIAERCEYYWGRHEALRQLCDAAKALRDRPMEKHWDEAEKEVAARMKPEIEEALRINREHDAEMEKLYGKK